MNSSAARTVSAPRAFTLIELLLVVAIIGILTSIVVVAGSRVRDAGRSRATEGTIRVMDQALTQYMTTLNVSAPTEFRDERGNVYPIIDARVTGTSSATTAPTGVEVPFGDASSWSFTRPAEPTGQLFLAVLKQADPSSYKLISGLAGATVPVGPILTAAGPMGDGQATADPFERGEAMQVAKPTDAWGQPIRYVVAKYAGGFGDTFVPSTSPGSYQSKTREALSAVFPGRTTALTFRRSAVPFNPTAAVGSQRPLTGWGDGDEGVPAQGRAYFYSAGRDNDPGAVSDNVYVTKPTFARDARQPGE